MLFKRTVSTSLIIATMFIGTAISLVKEHKEAQALSLFPFAGKLATVELCCNGLKTTMIHPPLSAIAYGTFIFQWQNMIPIPTIGWGLYSSWSLTPLTTVLGGSTPGGVCVTIYSECGSSDAVMWSISQMGTNVGPSNN